MKKRKARIIQEINRQMKLAKPLIGYLGNQYLYWKEQKELVKSGKIPKELKELLSL